MSKYVLDASALLALLNNEPGAQRVQEVLAASVVGAVNYCETLGKLIDAKVPQNDAIAAVTLLNLRVVPFDAQMAAQAAALVPQTRRLGLSLGDRACLALGMILNHRVVTTEHLWAKLNVGVNVEVIRAGR